MKDIRTVNRYSEKKSANTKIVISESIHSDDTHTVEVTSRSEFPIDRTRPRRVREAAITLNGEVVGEARFYPMGKGVGTFNATVTLPPDIRKSLCDLHGATSTSKKEWTGIVSEWVYDLVKEHEHKT